jgi:hypothetical protein
MNRILGQRGAGTKGWIAGVPEAKAGLAGRAGVRAVAELEAPESEAAVRGQAIGAHHAARTVGAVLADGVGPGGRAVEDLAVELVAAGMPRRSAGRAVDGVAVGVRRAAQVAGLVGERQVQAARTERFAG